MKKRVLLIFLILIQLFITTGCFFNTTSKLEGNDLIAYNMMLQVCYKANDPAKVSVISGTVTNDVGVFKVAYGYNETHNVLVSYKNGTYKVEEVLDQLVSTYSHLIYNTDDFNAARVNQALQEKWKR